MVKKKFMFCLVILVFMAGALSMVNAQSTALPVLKFSVTQSPLTVYPPFMVYTAQLSSVPVISTSVLKVEFYNSSLVSPTNQLELIGTALIDKTGKAVISKQMKAGAYVAVAKIMIGTNVIWSNKVEYKVN